MKKEIVRHLPSSTVPYVLLMKDGIPRHFADE